MADGDKLINDVYLYDNNKRTQRTVLSFCSYRSIFFDLEDVKKVAKYFRLNDTNRVSVKPQYFESKFPKLVEDRS